MSTFPGQTTMPAGYRMSRRFTAENQATWVEMDFRAASWFGACDILTSAERTAAQARGEIKRVNVTCDSGSVDLADALVPGDRYTQVDSAGLFPEATLDYQNAHGRYRIWYQTGGASDFEVEVFFDIPRESDV